MNISQLSDQELLRFAATAVGLCVQSWSVDPFTGDCGYNIGTDYVIVWNPLVDGNAALRLVTALGMEVYVDNHPEGCECVEVESHTHNSGRIILNLGSDHDADTRRAIVMCAALVGAIK